MIEIAKGNLLMSDTEALVNTVNCVGVMGKGVALQFKQAFPENFNAYHKACFKNEVIPGRMFIFKTGNLFNPKYIINFPTKRHWREKSKMEDIEDGLKALVKEIKTMKIQSIAIPSLGCGLGGLDWKSVRLLIEKALLELSDIKILLYAPIETPKAETYPKPYHV